MQFGFACNVCPNVLHHLFASSNLVTVAICQVARQDVLLMYSSHLAKKAIDTGTWFEVMKTVISKVPEPTPFLMHKEEKFVGGKGSVVVWKDEYPACHSA